MRVFKNILVTGGSGFIGANFIKTLFKNSYQTNIQRIINLDALTYAGNRDNNQSYEDNDKYIFIEGDISSKRLVDEILKKYKVDLIINFAAESHVDNSISGPKKFIETNVNGTLNLLMSFHNFAKQHSFKERAFLQVSTDEVFGSLNFDDEKFTEQSPYKPNSPYSASKASSDHLVRAWSETFNLQTFITNCSNNYGPMQNDEKLIPKVILSALSGKKIPIYGNGKNIRDWLFVDDHCEGIIKVFSEAPFGSTYNIGGLSEKNNIEVVQHICKILDELHPSKSSYSNLISFVKDRPGHDLRYAINPSKIMQDTGWKPRESFESGLKKTILWYLEKFLTNG